MPMSNHNTFRINNAYRAAAVAALQSKGPSKFPANSHVAAVGSERYKTPLALAQEKKYKNFEVNAYRAAHSVPNNTKASSGGDCATTTTTSTSYQHDWWVVDKKKYQTGAVNSYRAAQLEKQRHKDRNVPPNAFAAVHGVRYETPLARLHQQKYNRYPPNELLASGQ